MTRVQPNITRHGPWVKKHPLDPDEIWKQTTISDKYDVSSYGRIRNSKRGNVLKQGTKQRYKTVNLLKKIKQVHRLMALAFLGKPKKGQTVDHIDRKRYNNQISNLRWATKKEQAANRTKRKKQRGLCVFCVDAETSVETEFVSLAHAAESMTLVSPLSVGTLRQYIGKFVNKDEEYLGKKWFYMDQPVGEVRPIPSAPGYSASSCGLIQSLSGRWTRGWEFENYMKVGVRDTNKFVHRLVAETFLGTPSGDDIVVNHINGFKYDNAYDNLEYCTKSENSQHAVRLGLIQTNGVVRICKDSGKILQEHDSIKDAVSSLGKVDGTQIGKCCLGKAATAYGFRWSYPGESEKFAHLVKAVKRVLRICKNTGKVLQEYASIGEAVSFIGGHSYFSIKRCCMGKAFSAYGYKWSYIGEESVHEYAKQGKPVLRICKDTGEVLQTHESQTTAALFLGKKSGSQIGQCCMGKAVTAYGFRWSYPGESEKFAHLVKAVKRVLRICKNTGKVLQEYASIGEAVSFIGGHSYGPITRCCLGKGVSAYGYKWSYIGEESMQYVKKGKAVLRICKETNLVLQRHESQTEAALFVNGHKSSIGLCCVGKNKTACGYKWRFA